MENKFFYDKERKMWREEGKDIPQETAAPPPPPTAAAFLNGQGLAHTPAEHPSAAIPEPPAGTSRSSSGALPPIPANSLAAASAPRLGPRSRYVDPMNPE